MSTTYWAEAQVNLWSVIKRLLSPTISGKSADYLTIDRDQMILTKMAGFCKIVRGSLNKRNRNYIRFFHNLNTKSNESKYPLAVLSVVGGTVALFTAYKCRSSQSIHAAQTSKVSFYYKIAIYSQLLICH